MEDVIMLAVLMKITERYQFNVFLCQKLKSKGSFIQMNKMRTQL
jgi:hypothetical protein